MGQIVVLPVKEKLRRKQHYAIWFRSNKNRCVLRNYVIWGFRPIRFFIGTRDDGWGEEAYFGFRPICYFIGTKAG